jgi:hypothetical protein
LVTSARNLSEVSILSVKLKLGDYRTDGLDVSGACDTVFSVRYWWDHMGVWGTSIYIKYPDKSGKYFKQLIINEGSVIYFLVVF